MVQFAKNDILADTTSNFIKTGIVRLHVPSQIQKSNTLLNPELCWLRVSCSLKGNMGAKVIAVYAQAVNATRVITEENEKKTDLHIMPGVISEFKNKIPFVASVVQPFSSYGRLLAETEDQYYTRVSEILRHKQRPISARDICQIILEKFPEILKVKCHGNGGHNEITLPGNDIQIIVIPRSKPNGVFINDGPKADISTLYNIKKYISQRISPFIKVDVKNPVYERVKVACSIIFNNNVDKQNAGDNINRLNEDIKKFISPWLYDSDSDYKMDSKIYLSELLSYIKNCNYIGYVTGFPLCIFIILMMPQQEGLKRV